MIEVLTNIQEVTIKKANLSTQRLRYECMKTGSEVSHGRCIVYNVPSPSGKAQDFDSCIHWFESSWDSSASVFSLDSSLYNVWQYRTNCRLGCIAQLVEQAAVNRWVASSSLATSAIFYEGRERYWKPAHVIIAVSAL